MLRPLLGTSAVVFVANLALLVLQLLAGRLLAPFIGSSLETWTAVIAAFLSGIAVGNGVGARLAGRSTTRSLAVALAGGAVAAGWMLLLPLLLDRQKWHTALDLGLRIPVLAFTLGFPAAVALSLLTPLAIKLAGSDDRRTGLVSGVVFSVGTLGCLLGNYLTGFVLIPAFTLNGLVLGTAGLLALAALVTTFVRPAVPVEATDSPVSLPPQLPLPYALAAVVLSSFAGMTLELAAARLLAPVLGVSLFTWTGVVGVMLAGTSLGNAVGGWLADRTAATPVERRGTTVAVCLLLAAVLAVASIFLFGRLVRAGLFADLDIVPQVLAWTFALFFLPMFLLGTVTPQVVRLVTPDARSAGTVAGCVYAWSTAGAIAGTFATGYLLISHVGVLGTLLLAGAVPCVAVFCVARVRQSVVAVYGLCVAGGGLIGGAVVAWKADAGITAESNYYAIRVAAQTTDTRGNPIPLTRDVKSLTLDALMHSAVDLNDPTYLHYAHEQVQLEAVWAATGAEATPHVLVIGGGGYTLPRCVRTRIPAAAVEVVEIDPAVTRVAYSHLGLDPALGIVSHHQDGRQFVSERAAAGRYAVVSLDAVNDFTVPYHLLTAECHAAVKRTLTADGVYLVTVIDRVGDGQLWRATYHTLAAAFSDVRLVLPAGAFDPADPATHDRQVMVLAASERRLDPTAFAATVHRQSGRPSQVAWVSEADVRALLESQTPLVLTDQFAPVDNLMLNVYRRR